MTSSDDRDARVRPSARDGQAVSIDEVQARLEARLARTDLGSLLAARGITAVALDERGELTEYRPDGTSSPI